jgi:hypothetical protein
MGYGEYGEWDGEEGEGWGGRLPTRGLNLLTLLIEARDSVSFSKHLSLTLRIYEAT